MGRDTLSDVLRTVRLRGAVFFYVSGGREWAAESPAAKDIAPAVMPGAEHVMEYHVVIAGDCWAGIVGQPPVRLSAGDIVLFPLGDAHGSDFNYHFHVSFTPEERAKGEVYYNYGKQPFESEELPGISAFYKNDAGEVFHTYSAYRRGVEAMMGTYNLVDLTAKGRDEIDGPMAWVRHHDRYEPEPLSKPAAAASSACAAHS